MRLLHTTSLQLEEFFGSIAIPSFQAAALVGSAVEDRKIPKYAILSHVWGPDEVSFQDMSGNRIVMEKKAGFDKLRFSCAQARRDGWKYIWIDTCCIDKTSSTELSEAINSMFQWYKDSAICYVYLSDVVSPPPAMRPRDDPDAESLTFWHGLTFWHEGRWLKDGSLSVNGRYSRWFERGWTLQELLAPSKIQFFNKSWDPIGTKEKNMEEISDITGIDLFALNGGDLRRLSVARRMSWAANRETTRSEDRAYCLLGIFGINMPLLYGEGANAFVRLQEEIMKISDDHSLFAWKDPTAKTYRDDYAEASKPQGLLATSPKVFESSDTIAQFYSETPGRSSPMATNKGIQFECLMCHDRAYPSGLVYLAILSCHIGTVPGVLPAIRLRRLTSDSEQYARIDISELFQFGYLVMTSQSESLDFGGFSPTKPQGQLIDIDSRSLYTDWTVQTVFIRQETQIPLLPAFCLVPLNPWSTIRDELSVIRTYPPHLWDPKTRVMQPRLGIGQGTRKLGAFHVRCFGRYPVDCILIFGVTYWELTPWCEIRSLPWISDKGRPRSYLQLEFDRFDPGGVNLPSDMETRRHEYISRDLPLRSEAELKNVSGKDMYLLRLFDL